MGRQVREAEVEGVRYLYGDRHRWTKLATLISHMGLILFLIAGVVTLPVESIWK